MNKPSRRRITLRALLILMVLVGVMLIPVVIRLQEARRQKAAVKAIENLGGGVMYDYDFGEGESPEEAPKWLRRILGDDFYCRVHVVVFNDAKLSEKEIEDLKELTGLRRLFLRNAQITDGAFEHLKDLENLQVLDLSDTKVTDGELQHLKNLKNLVLLHLDNNQVSEGGMAKLRVSLPKCRIEK